MARAATDSPTPGAHPTFLEEERDLWAIIRALADENGEHPAILAPDRGPLSFAGLRDRMMATKEALNRLGIGRGDRVAVVLPDGPDMAVCCLSVIASATFVPLNPKYTVDELLLYFERIRPKAVVLPEGTESAALEAARARDLMRLVLAPDVRAPAGTYSLSSHRQADAVASDWNTPEDVALILLTSGTTSRPKLVPLRLRHLLSYALAMQRDLGLSRSDRSLHVMPMFHGHGIKASLLNPITAGNGVVCLPGFEIEAFFESMERFRPTWYSASYTMQQEILRAVEAHRRTVDRSNLRFIRSGSGRLDPRVQEGLEAAFRAPVIQRYSMSETCAIATSPLPPGKRKPGSVGVATNCKIRLLTGGGELLGHGGEGEVVVRGPSVFTGYLDDPEANRSAFVDGWFRTGDLGRLDTEGYLTLIGRLKEMINRGGEKISPLEVEEVLQRHPGVLEACVFGVSHPSLGEEVAAAIVPHLGVTLRERDLQGFAQERLSAFKVPRRTMIVESIPRSDTGKVDRRAASRAFEEAESRRGACASPALESARRPTTALEAALAGLWAHVLDQDRVGVTDNFFMLGGDSLSAVRLVSSVADLFGVELTAESLFDSTATVAAMAARIERGRAHAPIDAPTAMTRRPPGSPAPLSYQQQRLWFLDRLEGKGAGYLEPKLFRLRGPLNRSALVHAVRAVVQRHESLRTRFPESGGVPEQVVLEDAVVDLPIIDLSTDPDPETAAESVVAQEIRQELDLGAAPPVRFRLIRLASEHHLFLVIQHHIVSDGTSTSIFNRDLAAYYDRESAGLPVSLPDLPIQYADYALWQRGPALEDSLREHLEYWQERLEGAPSLLELPTDRPRTSARVGRAGSHHFDLDGAVVNRMAALCRDEDATPFMGMLAVFCDLLHRYSGEVDLVVGAPSSGRDRPELEELIGFFINILPLRADLSGNPTFSSLLGRVREVVKGALAHRDVPFEKLVEDLRPERNLSVTPVFQVVFNYRRADVHVPNLHALSTERVDLGADGLKYDLYLSLVEQGGEVKARLDYSAGLFDSPTIEQFAGHYRSLLASVVDAPERRLSDLPMLSEEERHRMLVEWNQTDTAYPKHRLIHELFEEQARATPDAAALRIGDQQTSYRELDAAANRLARYLRRRGVGAGGVVAIFGERGIEVVVGMIGVLKAGAAYLPIAANELPERLAAVLEDASVSEVLVQERVRSRLPGPVAERVILLDGRRPAWMDESPENLQSSGSDESLAYVIYTSGSTGRPKGVEARHRGAVNRFNWMWNAYPFREDEACCQKTALGFVDSVWEIFGPLLRGVPSVIVPDDVVRDPRLLVDTLARHRVTRIVLVPSLLESLLDAEPSLGQRLPRLDLWVSSGEKLSAETCRRFRRAFPRAVLLNLYGSSEVAADATCFDTSEPWTGGFDVPIGKPIANTRTYVLDGHDRPVPIAVWGQLHVAGDGLARGYVNRPDLTAQRFVADPFGVAPARMFRTGDRARWRRDGRIELSGRLDEQVKIRGNRVEPGEVDAALSKHPGVQSVATVARDLGDAGTSLVAYLVPKRGADVGPDQLRAHLRTRLPEYMVPSRFVFVETLPLTPSGKLDRRSLPAPVEARSTERNGFVAPRSDTERELASIWEEVLKVSPVGARDGFFDLGGHSILAARLVSEIERRTGRRIPLIELFRGRTVEHLARYLDAAERVASTPFEAIQTDGSRPPFFAVGSHPRYVELARRLGADQPFFRLDVYALQSERIKRRQRPFARIEDVAARFAEDIRSVQPTGPYYLGGGCEGSIVAFEIARQLQEDGESVGSLMMWLPPRPGWSKGLTFRRFAFYRLLRQLRSLAGRKSLTELGWNGWSELVAHELVEYRIFRAVDSYVPAGQYEGKLILIRTAERLSTSRHPTELWRELGTGGADVLTVPGDHNTWLEHHIDEFSRMLEQRLTAAQRGVAPGGVERAESLTVA